MQGLSFREPRVRTGVIGSLIRLVLVLGALTLLWRAEHGFRDWQQRYASEFRFAAAPWLGWVITSLLAGVVFGLAVWLPRGRARYRWGRSLVLAAPPLLLLTQFLLFVVGIHLPGPLGRVTPLWDPGPQFALAVLAGVAITSGFAEADREP